MRDCIKAEVNSISALDVQEVKIKNEVLAWVESGADLCRIEKPATPAKHLVSYFVVMDFPYMLLVDHNNAQLWLPTGGHVEPGEHPRDTVIREAREELGIDSNFLFRKPIFLTSTQTVGLTANHTDVSLWYVLYSSKNESYHYDLSEFKSIKWFHIDELPYEKTDPELYRFVHKFRALYV